MFATNKDLDGYNLLPSILKNTQRSGIIMSYPFSRELPNYILTCFALHTSRILTFFTNLYVLNGTREDIKNASLCAFFGTRFRYQSFCASLIWLTVKIQELLWFARSRQELVGKFRYSRIPKEAMLRTVRLNKGPLILRSSCFSLFSLFGFTRSSFQKVWKREKIRKNFLGVSIKYGHYHFQ